jgi:hypothetical protein
MSDGLQIAVMPGGHFLMDFRRPRRAVLLRKMKEGRQPPLTSFVAAQENRAKRPDSR